MSGSGFGHGGPVGEIFDVLPLDTTWHVADCGYDDNDQRCGCGDLPAKLRRIVDAARADALAEARDDIKARIGAFRDLDAEPQYLNALNDAWGLVANRERSARPSSPGSTKRDYVLDGSPEAVAIVREARGLPPISPPASTAGGESDG